MKANTIITSIVITLIGLTAYGFIQHNETEHAPVCRKTQEIKQEDPKPEFFYYVGGDYGRSITKENLNNATTLSDIISDYPKNWIKDYINVRIADLTRSYTSNGKNDILNSNQKQLLNSSPINSDLEIIVDYKRLNSVKNKVDTHQLNTTLTIIPEKEAEYKGGKDALMNYLILNSKRYVDAKNLTFLEAGSIQFIISENGSIIDTKLKSTSGYKSIDTLMLKLINDMPKWNPAKNVNGEAVKQKFGYSFGVGGC